jgi:hypothetical protein
MRRIHMPDIGVVAVQNDLTAPSDIEPCDFPDSGTLAHFASSPSATAAGQNDDFGQRPVRSRSLNGIAIGSDKFGREPGNWCEASIAHCKTVSLLDFKRR